MDEIEAPAAEWVVTAYLTKSAVTMVSGGGENTVEDFARAAEESIKQAEESKVVSQTVRVEPVGDMCGGTIAAIGRRHRIYGDYVVSPINNAFNSKMSWWITKKGCTLAQYCFSTDSEKEANDLLEYGIDEYIRLLEDRLNRL